MPTARLPRSRTSYISHSRTNGNAMIKAFSHILVLTTVLGASQTVRAENVDLSTVPRRNTVQLTIYNSEDITLVRETRVVTFKKGMNPLQFSWANTQIDPSSVDLKFLTSADKLDVLDTTFPITSRRPFIGTGKA